MFFDLDFLARFSPILLDIIIIIFGLLDLILRNNLNRLPLLHPMRVRNPLKFVFLSYVDLDVVVFVIFQQACKLQYVLRQFF